MKKMMKAMWILAASTLALASCVEEQALTPQNENPEMVNIKITAGAPVTKTHLDGKTMQVKWDTDSESIVVFENSVANNKTSEAVGPDNGGYNISADGATATFNVEFPGKSGNEFNYWGLYPAASFISADNADLNNFKMQIPSTQKPKAATFDYKADLLVSRKIAKKSQPWGLTFNFERPIAVVEMTLKGIADGEKITEVTFSSESAPITGQLTYNMNTNEVVAYGTDGQKKITLNTNLTAAAEGTKIYFTALPAELNDFTVTARTDKATYSKTVNCSGKNFGFKANTFTQFSVNGLTKKVITKPVVTINWDKNTELDSKGGNFTIPYTIENPVEGAVLSVSSTYGLLKNLKAENGNITFTMDANPDTEVRKDYLGWEYKYGDQSISGSTSIKQAAKIQETVTDLTFTFNVTAVTANDVTFDCTPSNTSATYVLKVMEKAEYDKTNDQAIIKKDIDFWKDPWNYSSIEDNLTSGAKTNQKLTLNKQGTEFYILAYGLNADGTITSKAISKVLVKSLALPTISFDPWSVSAPKAGGHFDVTVTISNGDDVTELTASTTVNWITNITVVKNSTGNYTASFDVAERTSGREGKILFTYGTVTKRLTIDQC